jgi:hypothetical protein
VLCAASVLMLLLSVFLQRGVYTALGAIGVASYLGYLAFGVTVMYPGYMYYRHQADLQVWLEHRLSPSISRLRP